MTDRFTDLFPPPPADRPPATAHETHLLRAQAELDALRPRWQAALDRRAAAVEAAVHDPDPTTRITMYRAAKILGVRERVVRKLLGLDS